MKINKTKITITTLALAMGAALAGSISGSVAWYQYSTRAAAQVTGTSAGTEGRLQVALHSTSAHAESDWLQKVIKTGDTFKPLSAKKGSDNSLTFYEHPVYQVAQQVEASAGYKDLELDFRFQENTAKTQAWGDIADKKIYLSHFAIAKGSGVTDENDVSAAVRVAFLDSSDKALFILSKNEDGETTATKGNLDLNKNNADDTMLWDCTDSSGDKIVYTVGADSYSTGAHENYVLPKDTIDANIYDLDTAATAASIPSVAVTGGSLKVRIWIEGWALLNSDADWTANYLEQSFDIQMQFITSAEQEA